MLEAFERGECILSLAALLLCRFAADLHRCNSHVYSRGEKERVALHEEALSISRFLDRIRSIQLSFVQSPRKMATSTASSSSGATSSGKAGAHRRPTKLAILTSGGDCSGMNAAVRAVVKMGIARSVYHIPIPSEARKGVDVTMRKSDKMQSWLEADLAAIAQGMRGVRNQRRLGRTRAWESGAATAARRREIDSSKSCDGARLEEGRFRTHVRGGRTAEGRRGRADAQRTLYHPSSFTSLAQFR